MRAVIFDLDGTLLDSMPMWAALDLRYLESHGITPPADLTEIMKTMTIDRAAAYYAANFPLGLTAQEVRAELYEQAAQAYRKELPLKDGAQDFLRALFDRKIPMALATVTFPELLDAALTRLDIAQYFAAVVTAADKPAGKHSPEIYLETAARLGAVPAETVVIEDALYAAQTAKQAGFYVIGLRDPFSASDWAALAQTADCVTDNWAALNSPEFFSKFD